MRGSISTHQTIVETERPIGAHPLRTCTYYSTVDTERSQVLQYIYLQNILLVAPYELPRTSDSLLIAAYGCCYAPTSQR